MPAPVGQSTLAIPTPAAGQSVSSTRTATLPRPAPGKRNSLAFWGRITSAGKVVLERSRVVKDLCVKVFG